MWCSHVDCAWRTMVGSINNVNLSNLAKVKLIKVLNNLGVACIATKISQTPTLEFIEWPAPSFNSLTLNMSDELTTTTTTKAHCFCLFMFANIFDIPSSFEDEELELFESKSTRTISYRNKTMVWKWSHDLQIKNPSTWVKSEKEKKWVRGAPTYIVLTH